MKREPTVRRVFRPKRWLIVASAMAAVLFTVVGASACKQAGWSAAAVAGVTMSLLAYAGLLEVATSRIALSHDALEAGSAWRRRRYPLDSIQFVTWESGCGVSVKLVDGGWAKLPELGYNSQSLANALRAWLRRSRQVRSASGAAQQRDEADKAR